jgi:hypothetical protein
MMKVVIQRYKVDINQSAGVLIVFDDFGWPVFISACIERGGRDNKKNISNINPGIYPLKLEYSERFKSKLYELKKTENRTEIKIHAANFWDELNGCIALGSYLDDIDNDGYFDVLESKKTMKRFHDSLKGINETTIEIINPILT